MAPKFFFFKFVKRQIKKKIFFRYFLFAILFGVLSFLPSANLIFTVGFVLAERVLYLPLLGICLILMDLTQKICSKFESKFLLIIFWSTILTLTYNKSYSVRLRLFFIFIIIFLFSSLFCPWSFWNTLFNDNIFKILYLMIIALKCFNSSKNKMFFSKGYEFLTFDLKSLFLGLLFN